MRPIIPKVRESINSDPYFRKCARVDDLEHCSGRITIEHCWIYAGRQIDDEWALIPFCWHHHLGAGLDKRLNELLSLRRATESELAKYPKRDWKQILSSLEKSHGFLPIVPRTRPTNLIVIPGNPVSINQAWRMGRGGIYLSGEAGAWKENVAWSAKTDWKRPILVDRLRISMTAYFGNKRQRDIDNVEKLALDGLKGIVFRDDSQVDDLRIIRKHDPKKPRLEITVEEIL